ncbi:MAG: dodecin family protein [Dehalococcoidia bacterium]|nr:dodecin family protein [Dehalococcoidia bacterium]
MAVVKVIELVGTSPNNWHEAVANAVAEASKTIRNITAVDVIHSSCDIQNNRIAQYKVNVKLSFMIERVTESIA